MAEPNFPARLETMQVALFEAGFSTGFREPAITFVLRFIVSWPAPRLPFGPQISPYTYENPHFSEFGYCILKA